MPAPADFAGDKSRSILFLKKKTFKIGENSFTRFQVATAAKVEPTGTGAKLSLQSEEFNGHLDEDQLINATNTVDGQKAQNGKYILVEGEGKAGLVFLKGKVQLKKQGSTDLTLVKGAWIFSDASPFITQTGSKGEFVLPVPEGATGTLQAYHNSVDTDYTAPGTPHVASSQITKAGLLDQYKGDFTGKMDEAGVSSADKTKATSAFDDLNKAVTDYLDAWVTVASDLLFVQPPQDPPKPPDPPAVPAQTPDPAPVPPADPTTDTKTAVTRESTSDPQVDLGCTGVDANGNSTFITTGAHMQDYATYKGWRVSGNVIASTDEATNIFGDPTTIRADADKAKRYPDQAPGYCVLTTGDGLYQNRKSADSSKDSSIFNPGPDAKGQVSEMWQKVKIPKDYKYIKIRMAFFSQEFPRYVGTSFNDSFFIKFDESPDFIARGNLNDLAGGKDKANEGQSCSSKSHASGTQVSCGEWKSINGSSITTGKLWNIDESTQAATKSLTYYCDPGSTNVKCFHGYVPARTICKKLDPETEVGKELTLRFNVSDAGDKYFDSALAIDTITFSNEDCDQPAFNGDARSKALQDAGPAGSE
jgi:hypothetical protein